MSKPEAPKRGGKRAGAGRKPTKPTKDTLISVACKLHRSRLSLTQQECGNLLWGMPMRTYQDIERGEHTPPEWAQKAIIEKLGREMPKRSSE